MRFIGPLYRPFCSVFLTFSATKKTALGTSKPSFDPLVKSFVSNIFLLHRKILDFSNPESAYTGIAKRSSSPYIFPAVLTLATFLSTLPTRVILASVKFIPARLASFSSVGRKLYAAIRAFWLSALPVVVVFSADYLRLIYIFALERAKLPFLIFWPGYFEFKLGFLRTQRSIKKLVTSFTLFKFHGSNIT